MPENDVTKSYVPYYPGYNEAAGPAVPESVTMLEKTGLPKMEKKEWRLLFLYLDYLDKVMERLDAIYRSEYRGPLVQSLNLPTRFFYGMSWPDYLSMRTEYHETARRIFDEYESRLAEMGLGNPLPPVIIGLVVVTIAIGLGTCAYFSKEGVAEITTPDEVKLKEAGFTNEQVFELQARNLAVQKALKLGNIKVLSKGLDLATVAVAVGALFLVLKAVGRM